MKIKVIYWVCTSLLFLFEGVMPAFTGTSELALEGIRHLGYPEYFGAHLAIMKVLGSIAIMLPMIKGRLKEWAYAGLFFDFLWAFISHGFVDGFGNAQTLFVLVPVAIWIGSYATYHQLQKAD
ncbi:MAG: hypothetical protein RL754_579 [Bacteroidota bacterium]